MFCLRKVTLLLLFASNEVSTFIKIINFDNASLVACVRKKLAQSNIAFRIVDCKIEVIWSSSKAFLTIARAEFHRR